MKRCFALGTCVILVILVTFCGCVDNQPVTPSEVIPVITEAPILVTNESIEPAPTEKPQERSVDDQKFIDAIETCFVETPEITNTSTHLKFMSCLQDAPNPIGSCEKTYREYLLEYTASESSTAGYKRATYNTHLIRDEFSRGFILDKVTGEERACE
jgi:hypothetical protein